MHRHLWLACRRPLFLAFLLGCTMSLTTTGSLTLRLVLSTILSWSFVPVFEIGALAIVLRGERDRPFASRIDSFFAGFGVWAIWLLGTCLMFAALPPSVVFRAFFLWLEAGAIAALLWSLRVDYRYFREVLGSERRAARALLFHRGLSWTSILLVISQPAILPTLLQLADR